VRHRSIWFVTLDAKTEFCKPDPFFDVYHC
jgi:hypothetical protein